MWFFKSKEEKEKIKAIREKQAKEAEEKKVEYRRFIYSQYAKIQKQIDDFYSDPENKSYGTTIDTSFLEKTEIKIEVIYKLLEKYRLNYHYTHSELTNFFNKEYNKLFYNYVRKDGKTNEDYLYLERSGSSFFIYHKHITVFIHKDNDDSDHSSSSSSDSYDRGGLLYQRTYR